MFVSNGLRVAVGPLALIRNAVCHIQLLWVLAALLKEGARALFVSEEHTAHTMAAVLLTYAQLLVHVHHVW